MNVAARVDRELAELTRELRFLFNITPTNAEEARLAFERSGYQDEPVFHYRPLTFDPSEFKRALFDIPLEEVDDDLLKHLFEEKREELDGAVSMLKDRDTPSFLQGSIRAFGPADDQLLNVALRILGAGTERLVDDRVVTREEFAERAREEIDRYREDIPDLTAEVELRDDMTGIMVLHGNLLLGADVKVGGRRVEPLIQHEVGTHIVTWENGCRQPLSLLSVGLAHYDETQEALAVLAEYAVDGLDGQRLELLAGRVVAARRISDGVGFAEVFFELTREHGFDERSAWNTTMRAFRGGGTTKDIIYLRGLLRLLAFLEADRPLEPLLVGKLPLEVAPFIEQLLEAEVIEAPAARPRWLQLPGAPERLQRARDGIAVEDLVSKAEVLS